MAEGRLAIDFTEDEVKVGERVCVCVEGGRGRRYGFQGPGKWRVKCEPPGGRSNQWFYLRGWRERAEVWLT